MVRLKGTNHGFDAVVGNPPYVFGEYHDPRAKRYFHAMFDLAKQQYDTYKLFIERGLDLVSTGGRFGMIVPDALLARDEAHATRALLLEQGLERVYHCGRVFGAAVSATVVIVAKDSKAAELASEIRDGNAARLEHQCARQRFRSDPRSRLLVHASDAQAAVLARLQTMCVTLDSAAEISRGEEIGKKHVLAKGPVPILVGEDLSRYRIKPASRYVEKIAKSGSLYTAPKLVVVKTGSRCIAALDRVGIVTMQSVYNVRVTSPDMAPQTLLAILNSRLASFFVGKTFTAYKLLFPQLNQTTIASLLSRSQLAWQRSKHPASRRWTGCCASPTN